MSDVITDADRRRMHDLRQCVAAHREELVEDGYANFEISIAFASAIAEDLAQNTKAGAVLSRGKGKEISMVRRRASATVQIKLRIKEPVRAKVERRARRRGVSLNQEIADCLEQAAVPEMLSSGTFDLHDLAWFSNLTKFAKAATKAAGYPEDEWRDLVLNLDDGDATTEFRRRVKEKADAMSSSRSRR